MSKKYYAVKNGYKPGIYDTWAECKAQVDGYSNAKFKSFASLEEAKAFLEDSNNDKKENVGEEETAIAYVDGSYNIDTKEYGIGVAFYYKDIEKDFSQKGNDENMAQMRNVAGEIEAARLAMEFALENKAQKVKIYHDYQGIASWCTGEWKANKEGTINYKKYYDAIKDKISIEFIKVKGHSGHEGNDKADMLAKKAIFDID